MVSVSKGWSFPEALYCRSGCGYHCSILVKDLCPVSDHRGPAIVKDSVHGSDHPVTSYIFYHLN